MATALKLKNDIKKLKAAISSKATPKSFVPKLKSQLEKAENELASMKKSGRPRKTSTSTTTKKTLTALQKLIQKKKFGVYRGAGVDLEKDAGEGALATGRRVSKGLKSNQWGDKSDNKGNVYYEYRPNRLDVKQPKKKQTYPKLEKGGYMAKGGKLEAGVYRVGKPTKVSPMLYEQKIVEIFENGDIATASDYGRKLTDFKLQSYPIISTEQLEAQYKMEKGGYMAKGGETVPYIIWVSKDGEKREFYGDYKSQRAAEMAMKKLWDSSDYKAMGNKPKHMYEKEGFYAEGGSIPEGYHQMPDGSIMADSAHMAKGGETKHYKDNVKEQLENLNEEISSIDKYLKKLENENSEDAYKASNNLRQYKSSLEAKKLHLEDVLKEKGGYMAKGGEADMLKEDDYVWNAVGKKLVVDKVTDDEYYLSGFMQAGSSPWSKVKVHEYIKNNEWSLKPKMAGGGEMHKADYFKDGGKVFSEKELKEILDEALGHFYQGLNQVDLAMRYLEVKGQGGLKTPLSNKLKLDDLKESIEKIEEYTSK